MKKISPESKGIGVGLRTNHFPYITKNWPKMDWFEAVTENFMDTGGRPLAILEKVRAHYPIALHGTSLSIGSTDPLRPHYMKNYKALVERIDPFLVSDHLCWTCVEKEELHDLLPLPFTEEALKHVVEKVEKVQNFLGRQMILENVSSYITYKHSVIPEWEFLREVARRSGCGILLDINNVYVNSFNQKFDPLDFLKGIPGSKVRQFHLSGHTDMGKFLFDTHTGEIIDPVWKLYEKALELYGPVSTLIEWDTDIPEFSELNDRAVKARKIYNRFKNSRQDKAPAKPVKFPRHSSPFSLPELERRLKSWIKFEKKRPDLNLNEQAGDPGHERMHVYSGGYKARVYSSISDTYEAVLKVVGEDLFSDLSNEYAAKYPSKHYNLNYVGKFFPEFLKKHKILKKYPFLTELAELEWAMVGVFDAYGKDPFETASLAGLSMEDWAKVKFSFQDHIFSFRADWPVLDIWKARGSDAPAPKIKKKRQDILLFRVGTEVHTRVMAAAEHDLLNALRKGLSLGRACAKIRISDKDSALIKDWFQFWVSAGLITGCKLPRSLQTV